MLTTHIRMFCNLVPRLQTAHKPHLIGRPIWFDPPGRESLKKMDFWMKVWIAWVPRQQFTGALGSQGLSSATLVPTRLHSLLLSATPG